MKDISFHFDTTLQHCFAKLPAIENGQYKFWFEHYYIADFFDKITLETSTSFSSILLQDGLYSKFIAPKADLLFRFDSDDSINEAGFVMHIKSFGKLKLQNQYIFDG